MAAALKAGLLGSALVSWRRHAIALGKPCLCAPCEDVDDMLRKHGVNPLD